MQNCASGKSIIITKIMIMIIIIIIIIIIAIIIKEIRFFY